MSWTFTWWSGSGSHNLRSHIGHGGLNAERTFVQQLHVRDGRDHGANDQDHGRVEAKDVLDPLDC